MDNTGLIYDKSRNSRSPKAENHAINMITRELFLLKMNISAYL
jgi:hypothetical protein